MEVHLHRFLDHPNVIKLLDYFEHAQAYVMVLERPKYHKDLFDYITEKRRLDENEARNIFRQVVEAVIYCEAKGIFHRDIKDENILLDSITGQVKLIDFGSGTVLENTLYTDYEGQFQKTYKYHFPWLLWLLWPLKEKNIQQARYCTFQLFKNVCRRDTSKLQPFFAIDPKFCGNDPT